MGAVAGSGVRRGRRILRTLSLRGRLGARDFHRLGRCGGPPGRRASRRLWRGSLRGGVKKLARSELFLGSGLAENQTGATTGKQNSPGGSHRKCPVPYEPASSNYNDITACIGSTRSPRGTGTITRYDGPSRPGVSYFTTMLTSLSGTVITFTTCFPSTKGRTFSSAKARASSSSLGVPNGAAIRARSFPFT